MTLQYCNNQCSGARSGTVSVGSVNLFAFRIQIRKFLTGPNLDSGNFFYLKGTVIQSWPIHTLQKYKIFKGNL
jgi:hypothetical protein